MLSQNQGTNEYRNSVARYGSNAIFPPTVFYHTIVKELTAADISSGVLVSFTLHFSFMLRTFLSHCFLTWDAFFITIRSYLEIGYGFLSWSRFVLCIFWWVATSVCNARKLMAGIKIKLGVTGADSNKVVYLCAPPMLVLKTKLPPSIGIGENGPSYRFEQLFWKN